MFVSSVLCMFWLFKINQLKADSMWQNQHRQNQPPLGNPGTPFKWSKPQIEKTGGQNIFFKHSRSGKKYSRWINLAYKQGFHYAFLLPQFVKRET